MSPIAQYRRFSSATLGRKTLTFLYLGYRRSRNTLAAFLDLQWAAVYRALLHFKLTHILTLYNVHAPLCALPPSSVWQLLAALWQQSLLERHSLSRACCAAHRSSTSSKRRVSSASDCNAVAAALTSHMPSGLNSPGHNHCAYPLLPAFAFVTRFLGGAGGGLPRGALPWRGVVVRAGVVPQAAAAADCCAQPHVRRRLGE
jgi:hypothetical protein